MRLNNIVIVLLLTATSNLMVNVSAQNLDPSHSILSELVRDTLLSNPGVQSAQAALDAAIARERAGGQPYYNPELQLEAEDASERTATVGLSQTIDWNNKRQTRGDVASYEREAIAAELHLVRQKLSIELLNSVIQNDVALQLSNLSTEREQLMQQFADLAAQRRQAGDLNQVELDLARIALAAAQLQKSQATFRLIETRQSLAAVLGEKQLPVFSLPDSPPEAEIDTPDIDQLLNNLPTIKVQVARLAAAGMRVKLRTLERRPDPTVGVHVGQEASSSLAGISVSVPLYFRNDFSAEVDGANADRMQVELEAQDLYRRTRALLTASLQLYQLTDSAWLNWLQAGQASLGSQMDILNRLWRAGEMSTADYLVQIDQTLDTRAAATELRGQLWQSWLHWLESSGQVDAWLGLTDTNQ